MKHLVILVVLGLFSGCSESIKITGQVKFGDGEPVNFGEVCFETPQNTFIGRLDDTGHYTVSNTEDGNGIPPGDYTVYLSGTSLVSTGKPAKTAARDKGNTELVAMTETVRVHPKYTQPGTDALKFAVKKDGEKHFDFTVERPPQKRR